jgi:thiamine pyrophosphate-dependent acetolactate synthase large subunit-like protein
MKDLARGLLARELSRREFARGMTALGFSIAAIESVLADVAVPEDELTRAGRKIVASGGEILAECLLAAGTEYVFDANSTGQSAFYDALMARPELKLIVAVQEGQAVSMAHGYELASGRPGMLMLPSIGMPNALSNLYNAWKDRSALVVLSDGSTTQMPDRDGFQQLEDWLSTTSEFTKWRWGVDRPEHIAEVVRRGIKLAATPPGGPVYVRVPSDVQRATGVDATIYPQSAFAIDVSMPPRPELIESAARALIEARNPMLNVGPEVTRAGANADAVELAELLSIPMTQGYSVYGDIPYRHPLFAGFYSMGYPRGLTKTDVFLNLGATMPDPTIVTASVPDGATVINARVEYDKIANTYPTDIAIAGGVGETARALIDAVSGMTTKSQRKKLGEARLAESKKSAAAAADRRRRRAARGWDATPMYSERLCFELDRLLDEDAMVVVETGDRSPQAWIDLAPGRRTLIGPTTGFALGWGIGAALGARIAQPQRQVIALVGDGAMLFGQLESLWTASRYDIPIILVVFDNRSYDSERGRIHFASRVARENRAGWKDMSCYLGNPDIDYVSIARGFDIEGGVISEPAQIQPVFERAVAANREGRPYLIDALIAQRGPGADTNWHPDISIAQA